MNNAPILPPTAPTWRDSITQDEPPRPRGRTGRTRLALDAVTRCLAVFAVCVCLGIGYVAWRAWQINPATLAAPAQSVPLRAITLRTDGVLDRAWVERTLSIAPGTGIMELDLAVLRNLLLRSGQVKSAVIARQLPDVLSVSVEERSPVLRLCARDADDHESLLFVARDGFVFSGDSYDEALVKTLPWLAGVSLARDLSGRGFVPIVGMELVSDLLGTVRSSAPTLSRSFQIISLARYATDGVLLVTTPEVAEVIFGAQEGFYPQIARLDYVLDELRARAGGVPIRSINLGLGAGQVPVTFDAAPASATPPTGKVHSRPVRSTASLSATSGQALVRL